MQRAVAGNVGDITPDYSSLLLLAGDAPAPVAEINLVLAANQLSAALLTRLAAALQAFQAAMAELGVADRVTMFTASDFGRTFTGTDGSDHGWGGSHLILRGAVNGGRFYGAAPVIANNGPDDVGQERLLPSTSVDQYAATLGQWFGISDTDLLTVLPNLGRWDVGGGVCVAWQPTELTAGAIRGSFRIG